MKRKASCTVRELSERLAVDLEDINTPTGQNGEVTPFDVANYHSRRKLYGDGNFTPLTPKEREDKKEEETKEQQLELF